jgi:hypothetical protein
MTSARSRTGSRKALRTTEAARRLAREVPPASQSLSRGCRGRRDPGPRPRADGFAPSARASAGSPTGRARVLHPDRLPTGRGFDGTLALRESSCATCARPSCGTNRQLQTDASGRGTRVTQDGARGAHSGGTGGHPRDAMRAMKQLSASPTVAVQPVGHNVETHSAWFGGVNAHPPPGHATAAP